MSTEQRVKRLRDGAVGFNEVSVFIDPKGDVVVMLSHSATMDDAAFVRVKPDDIAFMYGDPANEGRNARVNAGGAWDDD